LRVLFDSVKDDIHQWSRADQSAVWSAVTRGLRDSAWPRDLLPLLLTEATTPAILTALQGAGSPLAALLPTPTPNCAPSAVLGLATLLRVYTPLQWAELLETRPDLATNPQWHGVFLDQSWCTPDTAVWKRLSPHVSRRRITAWVVDHYEQLTPQQSVAWMRADASLTQQKLLRASALTELVPDDGHAWEWAVRHATDAEWTAWGFSQQSDARASVVLDDAGTLLIGARDFFDNPVRDTNLLSPVPLPRGEAAAATARSFALSRHAAIPTSAKASSYLQAALANTVTQQHQWLNRQRPLADTHHEAMHSLAWAFEHWPDATASWQDLPSAMARWASPTRLESAQDGTLYTTLIRRFLSTSTPEAQRIWCGELVGGEWLLQHPDVTTQLHPELLVDLGFDLRDLKTLLTHPDKKLREFALALVPPFARLDQTRRGDLLAATSPRVPATAPGFPDVDPLLWTYGPVLRTALAQRDPAWVTHQALVDKTENERLLRVKRARDSREEEERLARRKKAIKSRYYDAYR